MQLPTVASSAPLTPPLKELCCASAPTTFKPPSPVAHYQSVTQAPQATFLALRVLAHTPQPVPSSMSSTSRKSLKKDTKRSRHSVKSATPIISRMECMESYGEAPNVSARSVARGGVCDARARRQRGVEARDERSDTSTARRAPVASQYPLLACRCWRRLWVRSSSHMGNRCAPQILEARGGWHASRARAR